MRVASWIGGLLLAAGVVVLAWRGAEAVAVPAPENRTYRWEYRLVTETDLMNMADPKTIEAGLNKLGEDGWELVAVRSTYYAAVVAKADKVGVLYCMKRLKQGK